MVEISKLESSNDKSKELLEVEAFEKYLTRVGRPDLYRDKSNQICFLFNGSQVKFGNTTKVEVFFRNITGPKIIVNDVHNLIGA